MPYNLIHEEWIPVRRLDGSINKIRPYEITRFGQNENPYVSIASPRPDFNGALIQFLIGLVQTCLPPEDRIEWKRRLVNWPTQDELKAAFTKYEEAFNLDGDGPRFMQEYTLKENSKKTKDKELSGEGQRHPISYLLIGAPTKSTLDNNIAFFQKQELFTSRQSSHLCLPCAAAALFTMQTFAPSGGGGGEGKFVSIRGGGPFSTLVMENTLWESVYANVLNSSDFNCTKFQENKYKFPWLEPSSFITKGTPKALSSEEMHPVHVYWNLPRRISLQILDNLPKNNDCALCGLKSDKIVKEYLDATGGISYMRKKSKTIKVLSWVSPLHPLTSYQYPVGPNTAIQSSFHPTGINYRYWLGLVKEHKRARSRIVPSSSIRNYCMNTEKNATIWGYGYEMDKMKAVSWRDGLMPTQNIEEEKREPFEYYLIHFILAAESICRNLRRAFMYAWYGNPKIVETDGKKRIEWELEKKARKKNSKKKDEIDETKNIIKNIADHFWLQSETSFYREVSLLRKSIQSAEKYEECAENWHNSLCEMALKIFDEFVLSSPIESLNPKKITLARKQLANWNYSPNITEKILALPNKKSRKPRKPKGVPAK